MRMRSRIIVWLLAGVLGAYGRSEAQPGRPPKIATNVDPCTFFSKQEIESAFGVKYGPPKTSRNERSCTC